MKKLYHAADINRLCKGQGKTKPEHGQLCVRNDEYSFSVTTPYAESVQSILGLLDLVWLMLWTQ